MEDKFKVGDEVRVLKYTPGYTDENLGKKIGDTGKVTGIEKHNDYGKVVELDHRYYWPFSDIEIVEKKPTSHPNHCQACGANRQDFGVVCAKCFMERRYVGERTSESDWSIFKRV